MCKTSFRHPVKYSVFSVSDYYPSVQPSQHRFIMDQVELVQAAEANGYYAYFNAEHHFHEYGLVPEPAVLFGAVAMKSSRIKIGPAVSILPFQHPLHTAENWALVDQLSKGRLILGVGSGYLMHEFEGFALSPANKRQLFDESLEVIELALTGKRFSYEGENYKLKNVRLNLLPYEGRKIEMAIAVLTETASYYIGRRGYKIMTIPYAMVEKVADLAPIYAQYRKGAAESAAPDQTEVMAAVHVHVCDQPADKDTVAREHLERYVYSRLYARHASYDECLERGIVAMGTPDQVAATLQNMINTGVDHLMMIFNFGGMPLAEVEKGMALMQKEVIPQLRPYGTL